MSAPERQFNVSDIDNAYDGTLLGGVCSVQMCSVIGSLQYVHMYKTNSCCTEIVDMATRLGFTFFQLMTEESKARLEGMDNMAVHVPMYVMYEKHEIAGPDPPFFEFVCPFIFLNSVVFFGFKSFCCVPKA